MAILLSNKSISIFPRYTHIIKPTLKHIYLSFDDDGELVIKSPHTSQAQIEKLLIQKAAWVNKSKAKLQNKKGKALQFDNQDTLYFLGEPHSLQLITYAGEPTKLTFDGETFILYYSNYDENIFQKHINQFYKEEAQNYIPSLLDKWSQEMKLPYREISFRKTKRQWGSCSSKNNLSFNTMIMKLPLGVIQYIIIHELAHIRHKHHQKAFWTLVQEYQPDYKHQIAILKQFTT